MMLKNLIHFPTQCHSKQAGTFLTRAVWRQCNDRLQSRFYTTAQTEFTEEDHEAARVWLQDLDENTIPSKLGEVTYSRSSGPGGQNVNKVNSKATLRLPLKDLLPLIPALLHRPILESRYHAQKSGALVIQADGSRKQRENADNCSSKLVELFRDESRNVVKGATTSDKAQKALRRQQRNNDARLKAKMVQSSKKVARKGGRSDY